MKYSLKNNWDSERNWFAFLSSVFEHWFSLISVMVSIGRKKLSSKDGFHQIENLNNGFQLHKKSPEQKHTASTG